MSGAVAASSCASTASHPVAMPSTPTTPSNDASYPDLLSVEDQATIARLDTLRPLDPCGYLDDTVVHRIGTPDYIGADDNFECSVHYSSAGDQQHIRHIAVFLSSVGYWDNGTPPAVGDLTVGTRAFAASGTSTGGCEAGVPVGEAGVPVDDRLVIAFAVFEEPQPADRPKTDVCAVASDLATAAVPHRLDRPLRTNSPYAHMNSRLAALDPCAVVGQLAHGPHPRVYPNIHTTDPWACTLEPDTPKVGQFAARVFIRYGFLPDSQYMAKGETTTGVEHKREIMIGGLRATQRWLDASPDHCAIHLSTAPQPPVIDPDTDTTFGDAGRSEIIEIIATTPDCSVVRAAADELARLYNQLPR
ncbi:hypothetical protein [Nocardia terpenica]|uniref:DUF3558 domain-containing protein n=1 Tax=Nocardia terpenica TaxID=455432 RepID=A0A6G9Z7P8_9NOCA|nr:hypothetical protein [Nocardia terpenica]QIS21522.1 hypothetical protein F6W96_27490 [Nocardia terpenica]